MYNCPSVNKVKESRPELSRSEQELYRVWLEETFDQEHLQTEAGQPVSILSVGKRNELEGPDFFDGMIIIGNQLKKGKIEIHVDNSDWYNHGHHLDSNYNDVVLHVVINNEKNETIKTNNDNVIPILVLQNYVLEPVKNKACTGWKNVNIEKAQQLLERYGEQRLNKKSFLLKSKIESKDPEEVLYKGLLDVMGYSKNRTAFKKLAQAVPYKESLDIISEFPEEERIPVLEALYLGTGGLLEDNSKKYFNSKDYLNGLIKIWHKLKNAYNYESHSISWHFVKSRPANHPTVRILGLVQIIHNFFPSTLVKEWLKFVARHECPEDLYKWGAKYFQNPSGMWQNHPLLHKQNRNKIIGDKRLMDLFSNYLIPLAKSIGILKEKQEIRNNAICLSKSIKKGAVPNIIRKMFNRWDISTRKITSNNLLQGSIEFYRSWCKLDLCKLCPMEQYADQK